MTCREFASAICTNVTGQTGVDIISHNFLRPPFSLLQAVQSPIAHRPTNQTQRGKADFRCHATHLPVFSFGDNQLQPSSGNSCTVPDRRLPGPQTSRLSNDLCPTRLGDKVTQIYTGAQVIKVTFAGYTLDLGPICFGKFVARVANSSLERAIIGQDDQTFTIGIQPTGGIDVRHGDKIL